jgi:hypothetical protein
MKLRLLLVWPFLLAAALLVLVRLTANTPEYGWAMRVEIELLKALALIGCWAAAAAFERGDYLRRAWFLSGLCYFLLLVRDVAIGAWTPWAPGPYLFGVRTEIVESVLVFVANFVAVWGTVMLARAWQVAGLGEADSALRRRALFIVAFVIALVVVGSNVHTDVMALMGGNLNALVILASDVGDVVSLALIAPVLLTALALRGGLLLWPWALITVSMVGWLFYDASTSVGHVLRGNESLRVTGEIFRSFACSFGFIAGLAQRFVLQKDAR